MKRICLFLLIATPVLLHAQNIDRNEIKFEYIQLPAKPLDKNIKNYHCDVVLEYEKDNIEKKKEYQEKVARADADYQQAMVQYDKDAARAQEDYKQATADYNKLSTGEKFKRKALLNEGKPVLAMPSRPYKNLPAEEKKSASVNTDMIAATYGKLSGYQQGIDNAVKITLLLSGFVNDEPQNEKKDYTTIGKNSAPSSKYSYKVSYKYPMGYKVESPNGEVMVNDFPKQFDNYVTASTTEFSSESALMDYWNKGKDSFLEKLKDNLMKKNLQLVSDTINDMFGYRKRTRTTDLYEVTDKAGTYKDYEEAYTTALAGYKLLGDESTKTDAFKNLKKAIALWENAMKESDPKNKRARVNADVTQATLHNLAEANSFVNETARAQNAMDQMMKLDLSNKEERHAKQLADFIQEQKKRFEANQ